jgi:hypothetical protein
MVDRYTKLVLTVIAACLVTLVAQHALSPTIAQTGRCGEETPCKVVNVYPNERSPGEWIPCYEQRGTCFVVKTH